MTVIIGTFLHLTEILMVTISTISIRQAACSGSTHTAIVGII